MLIHKKIKSAYINRLRKKLKRLLATFDSDELHKTISDKQELDIIIYSLLKRLDLDDIAEQYYKYNTAVHSALAQMENDAFKHDCAQTEHRIDKIEDEFQFGTNDMMNRVYGERGLNDGEIE